MSKNENDKTIDRTSQSCAKSKIFALLVVLSVSTLVVKLETTHKPAKPLTNHPQTSQITQKLPTNLPNYPQNSQIPNKLPTNQPKIALFFPWRHFLWTATFSLPIPCKKRNGCIFMFLLDSTFCFLHSTILYHPQFFFTALFVIINNFLKRCHHLIHHLKKKRIKETKLVLCWII